MHLYHIAGRSTTQRSSSSSKADSSRHRVSGPGFRFDDFYVLNKCRIGQYAVCRPWSSVSRSTTLYYLTNGGAVMTTLLGFSSEQVCRLTGLSGHQLSYWANTGL